MKFEYSWSLMQRCELSRILWWKCAYGNALHLVYGEYFIVGHNHVQWLVNTDLISRPVVMLALQRSHAGEYSIGSGYRLSRFKSGSCPLQSRACDLTFFSSLIYQFSYWPCSLIYKMGMIKMFSLWRCFEDWIF